MKWLSRCTVALVVCAGGWVGPGGVSVSAEENVTDAIKMIDTDKDGTIDLAEVKAAAAAMFINLDTGHDGIRLIDEDKRSQLELGAVRRV